MTFLFVRCDCGERLRLNSEHAGKNGRCKKCRRRVAIPAVDAFANHAEREVSLGDLATFAGEAAVETPQEPELPAPERTSQSISETWRIGQVIDERYEVKGTAQGGMGIVYFTHDNTWDLDIAVKTLLPRTKTKQRSLDRLIDECLAWVELGLHPNVITAYFVKPYSERPHLFLEYANAGDLSTWLTQGKVNNLAMALDIAIQVAHGLTHIHRRGMIHRDLKPANILLHFETGAQDDPSIGPVAKITDFGLVKQALGEASIEGGEASSTSAGGVSLLPTKAFAGGTPNYASPEQFPNLFSEVFNETPELSPALDVYAFGAILYYLMTGRPAFAVQTPPDAATWTPRQRYDWTVQTFGTMHVEQKAPRLADVPDELRELATSCLAKRRGDRPSDMAAVVEKLKSIYRSVTSQGYVRELHDEIEHIADGFNNKAVSLWQLGRHIEAEEAWRNALANDSQHLEATYNLGLAEWRTARVDDVAVRHRLRELTINTEPWRFAVLAAQLELERNDCEAAIATLEAPDVSGRKEVQSLLAMVRDRLRCSEELSRTFEGHSAKVNSVCLSADGRYALSGSRDKTLKVWELSSGRCLRTFEGHADQVLSVSLSPEGRYALSGSNDRT